ncbi:MAG: DUF1015 domain-containing protein [Lachnospiraceae bacterium]
MPMIRPFKCVRPAGDKASAIAALPYDVYNRKEAKEVVGRNPLSFLKIDRAETQFPDETDMYSTQVYERARDTLEEMMADGSFVTEEEPCFYLYALTYEGRTQTGIVGCASVDDYLNGSIRRHENTKEDKERDRICHVDIMDAQTGPIFLAYREQEELKQIVDEVKRDGPIYDFVSEDGIRHQVWKISSGIQITGMENAGVQGGEGEKVKVQCTRYDKAGVIERISEIFAGLDCVYIADGHHRAASAVKVGQKRRMEHPDYDGTEEFNYFLSVLFPAEELQILDYNRVVTGLNGRTFEELLEEIGKKFHVRVHEAAFHPERKGEIAMYGNGRWYRLTVHEELYTDDPVDDLDVSILQNHILDPLLGIRNPKADPRIQFIGGIRGLDELVRLVDEPCGGEEDVDCPRLAFAMYPTSMEELLAVADVGRLMPPKSTWFEPKLRSGLFIHMLSES